MDSDPRGKLARPFSPRRIIGKKRPSPTSGFGLFSLSRARIRIFKEVIGDEGCLKRGKEGNFGKLAGPQPYFQCSESGKEGKKWRE
jgi:hypothetical protein